jgi:hypothetical protein
MSDKSYNLNFLIKDLRCDDNTIVDIYFIGADNVKRSKLYDESIACGLYIKPLLVEIYETHKSERRRIYRSQLEQIVGHRKDQPGLMRTWICRKDTISNGLNILRIDTGKRSSRGSYIRKYLQNIPDPRIEKILMDKYGTNNE